MVAFRWISPTASVIAPLIVTGSFTARVPAIPVPLTLSATLELLPVNVSNTAVSVAPGTPADQLPATVQVLEAVVQFVVAMSGSSRFG